MNMTPIFELADILHTPEGVAIGGAYSPSSPHQSLSDVLAEINQHLEQLTSVNFYDRDHHSIALPVKLVKYTTSIADGVNLFFLLGHIDLPEDLTPGTIIYRDLSQSPDATTPELSVSPH